MSTNRILVFVGDQESVRRTRRREKFAHVAARLRELCGDEIHFHAPQTGSCELLACIEHVATLQDLDTCAEDCAAFMRDIAARLIESADRLQEGGLA